MNAEQIQNDTLTILLSNRIHRELDVKSRAIKISKTCKIIRDRTKDEILYSACRNIIKWTQNGKYWQVIDVIYSAEQKYYNEYGA